MFAGVLRSSVINRVHSNSSVLGRPTKSVLRHYSHNLFNFGFGLNPLSRKGDQRQFSLIAPYKGIWPPNPGSFCSWNLEYRKFFPMESKILGFGLRNTSLGIRSPLTIGIRNPVAGIWNPRVWNLESKTVLDSLWRPLHNQEKKL